MRLGHLWKSLFVLGITVIVISFIPSSIFQATDDLSSDYYRGHLIQCPEDPFLVVTETDGKSIALYMLTIVESARLMNGTPIEDVSTVFSLVNVSEWSGIAHLGAPGLYVVFVTAVNQSETSYCSIYVFRSVPQFRVLIAGMAFLVLAFAGYLFKSPRIPRLVMRHREGMMERKETGCETTAPS